MSENKYTTSNNLTLVAVSNSDGETPVYLWADPTTHALAVNATATLAKDDLPVSGATEAVAVAIVDGSGDQITSFGGGVQYTEGDTDTSITGTALMWEDASDTLRAVSSAKPLPVDIISGSSSGEQYDTNVAYQDGDTGTLALVVRDDALATLTEADGDYSALRVTSIGALWVEDVYSAANNTYFGNIDTSLNNIEAGYATEGSALGRGVLLQGDDGTDRTNVLVDTDGHLQIDVLSAPTTTVQATNLDIRDLSSASDSVAAVQSGTWNITNISGTISLPTGAATAANQNTIIGHVDGIETLLGTIDADTSDIHTNSDTIAAGFATEGSALGSGVLLQGDDGTDRKNINVDATTGDVQVDVTNTVTVDGSGVTQPVSHAALTELAAAIDTEVQVDVVGALPAGDNNIGNVDLASSIPAGTNNIGDVDIASALPAGTNNIGDVDIASIAAGSNLIGDVGLSGARTAGGTTPYKNLDVDESEDQVKGTAGQVYWIHAINTTAAPLYLKFYNDTAANVTVGTTTPTLTFPVPANADSDGAGFTLSIPNGIAFSTAITIAATTGVADNDTGAPGANALIVNLGYA